jgi:hypothetical protein
MMTAEAADVVALLAPGIPAHGPTDSDPVIGRWRCPLASPDLIAGPAATDQ